MNVGFETFHERLESDPIFKALLDGRCQTPHWGYVLEGEFAVRYGDGEENVRAGDAYYRDPGHTVTIEAGTSVIEFGPLEQY